MKFSHSIQFNAVTEWSSHYIAYSNLKKLIYQLEKQLHSQSGHDRLPSQDAEASPLLTNGHVDEPDKVFSRKLDDELEKICSFYKSKELEIFGEVDALQRDVQEFENEHEAGDGDSEGGSGLRKQSAWARARQQSIFKSFKLPPARQRRGSAQGSREATIPEEDDSAGDNDDEHSSLNRSQTNERQSSDRQSIDRQSLERKPTKGRDLASGEAVDDEESQAGGLKRRPSTAFNDFGDDTVLQALYDEGITLKKRTINLYVSVCELRSFVQLNETGFSKVLKKYDKTLDRNLKSQYINANVRPAYPFQSSTFNQVSENLHRVESAYATIVTKGDVEAAKQELRLHLREHVVWERNTVWREMIGIERKAQAANLGIRQTMLGHDSDTKKRLQGDSDSGAMKEIRTALGKTRVPKFLVSSTFWVLVICIAIFAVLLAVPIMEKPEQQNCLAMLTLVSLLWATEVCEPPFRNGLRALLTACRPYRCSSLPC